MNILIWNMKLYSYIENTKWDLKSIHTYIANEP